MFGLFKKKKPYEYQSDVPGFMRLKQEIEDLMDTADNIEDLELIFKKIKLLSVMAKYKGDADIIYVLQAKLDAILTELKA